MHLRQQGILLSAILAASAALAQSAAQKAPSGKNATPVLQSTSTYVSAPALARSSSGDLLDHWQTDGVELFDNGIPQKVLTDNAENQPISVVILMQTGGMASRYFGDYGSLPSLLGQLYGKEHPEISLITFDSRIEEIWHFPARSDGVLYALTHQQAGDGGAAILDAIKLGVSQLEGEPGKFRRIVLLLSQSADDGSKVTPEDVVKQLGMASTVVYSLSFPLPATGRARRTKAVQQGGSRRGSSPLNEALFSMSQHTAEEVALLTGGDSVKFSGKAEFDSQLLNIDQEIRDTNMLGFQPRSNEPGFHAITVRTMGKRHGMKIQTRTGYWFAAPAVGQAPVAPQQRLAH